MIDESQLGEDIYEEHLPFTEMVLGIKEGRFF